MTSDKARAVLVTMLSARPWASFGTLAVAGTTIVSLKFQALI